MKKTTKESYMGKPEDMKLKQKPLNALHKGEFAEAYEYLDKSITK